MKKIAYVLIILGIIIAANPLYKEVYRWYWEQKLLDEFNKGENVIGEDSQDQNKIIIGDTSQNGQTSTGTLPQKVSASKQNGIIGVLEIKKINLTLPVLQGSSTDILDRAGGHMIESDLPGKEGNCAIAAHRSYTYGRYFNRLNEIVPGDTVSVRVATEVFNYQVYDKVIVLPDDTSVLERQKGQTILSLITCDPMKNPTHRLVVHAKLIK